MEPAKRQKILREADLIKSLDHPHIISCVEHFIEDNVFVLIFEWAAQGDIKKLIKRAIQQSSFFDERTLWNYCMQIADGVRHMHERRVLHRDIKPANIFVAADGSLKIGDLGLGREFSSKTVEAFSKVGTPLYMSPEVIQGSGYDWKSDIWSIGCVLYELATLRSPFRSDGSNIYGIFKKIKNCEYDPVDDRYSPELRQTIHQMLQLNPELRPTAQELYDKSVRTLKHLPPSAPSVVPGLVRASSAGVVREELGGAGAQVHTARNTKWVDDARGGVPNQTGLDPARGGGLAPGHAAGEDTAFAPVPAMETILEKLRLLNYEERFLAPRNLAPFSPVQFAVAPPKGREAELFWHFSLLLQWLLSLCSVRMECDREDEPSVLVANACVSLKQVGIPAQFPPAKLRIGYGDVPCVVLNNLLNICLKATGFAFAVPDAACPVGGDGKLGPRGSGDERDSLGFAREEDDPGVLTDEFLWVGCGDGRGMDASLAGESGDSDGSGLADAEGYERGHGEALAGNASRPARRATLFPVENTTDPAAWAEEVAAVSSQLVLGGAGSSYALRAGEEASSACSMRLVAFTKSSKSVLRLSEEVAGGLEKLRAEIQETLARVRSREENLEKHLVASPEEICLLGNRLAELASQQETLESVISEKSSALSSLETQVETSKAELQATSSAANTEASPTSISHVMQDLRAEIRDLDARITLLQTLTLSAARRKMHQ